MRFLCISDIHGHADALRKVLDDAQAREYHQLVVCGDSLFPGPEPLATWKLLVEKRALCVQGVSDRALYELDASNLKATVPAHQQRIDRMAAVQKEVGQLIIARLGKLPTQARLSLESGQEALVVHGSPVDPTEALSLEMEEEELDALLGNDDAQVIICGASHVPFHRQIGGRQIVSVGSVGESPTPDIAYATIVDSTQLGLSVEQFEVQI